MSVQVRTNTYFGTVLNETKKPSYNDDRKSATMLYLTTRSGGAPMKGGPSQSNDNDDEDQRKGGN